MTHSMMKWWFRAVIAVALVAYAALAKADGPGPLELGVATGYMRGHGPAAGRMMPNLQDLAGDGAAIAVELGWRIDPRWMAGTYFEVGRLASGSQETDGMTSLAAGIQGQVHLAPASRLDPWFGLGAGWRGLELEHAAGTHMMQGLDLARVQLGVAYRVSDRLAVAPTVGISFTRMLSEKRPGTGSYSDIEQRRTGHFVLAGVAGRFDVLGGSATRD
jgi:hypothetical protein